MNTNPVPVVCVLSFQDPEAAGFLTSALLLPRVTPPPYKVNCDYARCINGAECPLSLESTQLR